jgi:hypothetical protein
MPGRIFFKSLIQSVNATFEILGTVSTYHYDTQLNNIIPIIHFYYKFMI